MRRAATPSSRPKRVRQESNANTSGQEPPSEPRRADVRVEIDVEIARVAEQLGQRLLRGGEMRVGHEDPLVPHLDVPVGEVEVRADRRGEPPDDRAARLPREPVMNVSEPDALVALVVDD